MSGSMSVAARDEPEPTGEDCAEEGDNEQEDAEEEEHEDDPVVDPSKEPFSILP